MSLFNINVGAKLVLASASPRRRKLLKLISEDFITVSPDVDETVPENTELLKRPQILAVKKAVHVCQGLSENAVVIGCDTGVFTDNKMLGKPKDEEEAFAMLKSLSGRDHLVATGCCITDGKDKREFSVISRVFFYPLSDGEIWDYIATGEPMDKAGAYGIQGKGSLLIKEIQGDYFNIVGLPLSALARELSLFCEENKKP